jgi:hypothetical protein
MSIILLLEQQNSVVSQQLRAMEIQLVHFSEVSNEGVLWPNLIKRCDAVLVSGLTGLVDDDPKLDAILSNFLSMGLHVQVFCSDRPVPDISEAIIGGVHYQFGVDVASIVAVNLAIRKLLDEQPSVHSMMK